ncbi:hypothetical protein TURU_123504 [Turdus rufiventris]|nr:hypothetical protein TURU_123504 [Turdus rufiventris]
MLRQLCPCSPWRSEVEQRSTCSPWRTAEQSRCMPKGGCEKHMLEQTPGRSCQEKGTMERGAHAGAGLLAGLVTLWGTHKGAGCSWGTAHCGKDTEEEFMKNCPLWEVALEYEKSARSSPLRRKEQQR